MIVSLGGDFKPFVWSSLPPHIKRKAKGTFKNPHTLHKELRARFSDLPYSLGVKGGWAIFPEKPPLQNTNSSSTVVVYA